MNSIRIPRTVGYLYRSFQIFQLTFFYHLLYIYSSFCILTFYFPILSPPSVPLYKYIIISPSLFIIYTVHSSSFFSLCVHVLQRYTSLFPPLFLQNLLIPNFQLCPLNSYLSGNKYLLIFSYFKHIYSLPFSTCISSFSVSLYKYLLIPLGTYISSFPLYIKIPPLSLFTRRHSTHV